jgi:hypothetical protein
MKNDEKIWGLDALHMEGQYMVIEISNEAKGLMEERGIQEADVKEVVEYAETTQKLYEEGGSRCLGKKRLGEFTVYAEYTRDDSGKITVENAYSHRVKLTEDGE